MQKFRQIHQTDRFKQHLAELHPESFVAQEFIKAASRTLRTHPEKGLRMPPGEADEIWMLSQVEVFYQPKVLIFYEFDEYNVWLLDVVPSTLDDFEF